MNPALISECGRCRAVLRPGDRIVTAAHAPPRAQLRRADQAGEVMQALGHAEYDLCHADCRNPNLAGGPVASLSRSVQLDRCARCRLAFQQGDRIVTCFIVQHVSRNPAEQTLELQTYLNSDVELAHAECRDPSLDGRLVNELRSAQVTT